MDRDFLRRTAYMGLRVCVGAMFAAYGAYLFWLFYQHGSEIGVFRQAGERFLEPFDVDSFRTVTGVCIFLTTVLAGIGILMGAMYYPSLCLAGLFAGLQLAWQLQVHGVKGIGWAFPLLLLVLLLYLGICGHGPLAIDVMMRRTYGALSHLLLRRKGDGWEVVDESHPGAVVGTPPTADGRARSTTGATRRVPDMAAANRCGGGKRTAGGSRTSVRK